MLDPFYDQCADAIWEHDGLLNKTIGDAIMAVFNFPIADEDRARSAVRTARDKRRWSVDQILVTQGVHHRVQPDLAGSPAKAYQLRGFRQPIELYVA